MARHRPAAPLGAAACASPLAAADGGFDTVDHSRLRAFVYFSQNRIDTSRQIAWTLLAESQRRRYTDKRRKGGRRRRGATHSVISPVTARLRHKSPTPAPRSSRHLGAPPRRERARGSARPARSRTRPPRRRMAPSQRALAGRPLPSRERRGCCRPRPRAPGLGEGKASQIDTAGGGDVVGWQFRFRRERASERGERELE